MRLIVRSAMSQRRIEVAGPEELDSAIKEAFGVEKYSLYEDSKRTVSLSVDKLREGLVLYLGLEVKEAVKETEKPLCSHSPAAVCSKCATLDPLDRKRTDGVAVKYLSEGSYREMLRDRNASEPEHNYAKEICEDHPANVRCHKCSEKTISLLPQVYRTIDYVEFDSKAPVEAFIQRWQTSGRQRLGLLVGSVSSYDLVPLGKKVVVSGIWEIDQEAFPDGFAIESIPKEFIYNDLRVVGLIYTDLWLRDGAYYSYKEKLDLLVSACELRLFYDVETAVQSDAFVHVCLSSDSNNNIVPNCYMITKQFKGLVKAGVLALSTDPAFFITEKDIFYLVRNEYNRNVKCKAFPRVPVDYFIVKCETGYQEKPVFSNPRVLAKNTPREIARALAGDYSFNNFKSFSLLVALKTRLGCAPQLFKAVVTNDEGLFNRISQEDEFKGFLECLRKYDAAKWSCKACTFVNDVSAQACEVCEKQRMEQECSQ